MAAAAERDDLRRDFHGRFMAARPMLLGICRSVVGLDEAEDEIRPMTDAGLSVSSKRSPRHRRETDEDASGQEDATALLLFSATSGRWRSAG